MKLFHNTDRGGKYSITVSAVESWNKIQKQLKSILVKDPSPNKIKTVDTNFYFKSLITHFIMQKYSLYDFISL